MSLSPMARTALRLFVGAVLVVVYAPLFLILTNSFNASRVFEWPPTEFTLTWWSSAISNQGARDALLTSLRVAFVATIIALVLGTLVAFAVGRYRWFGREPISFLVVLPIALPGIVTGIALQNAFLNVLGLPLSILTVIVGHATFCIVVVFNNVVARLRRMSNHLEEASMDLGATTFQTFRLVTFPQMRSALLAGGLLAFGLSFDEIIVTLFTTGPGIQTLPIWIFNNLARPNQAPIVSVVAAMVIVLSVIPVYFAQRVSGDTATGGRV